MNKDIMVTVTEHRLTWRMYCGLVVKATTKEEAIAIAIATRPAHIPESTELHYGMVTMSRNAVNKTTTETLTKRTQ